MNTLIEKFGNDKRWVAWKMQVRQGKKTKLPYQINGKLASSTDPLTWSTYDDVKKYSENIGIVFTPDKKLLGIDIDHCLKNSEIEHEQKEAIEKFIEEANSYCEVSPSGEGLHLFLDLSEPLELTSNKRAPYEAYSSGRYFTFTNQPYKDQIDLRTVSATEALSLLAIIEYPWNSKIEHFAEPGNMVMLDDATVLERMFAASNGAKIRTLYDGDISAYNNDDSNADMGFLSHLVFWTRKDAAQMERIWLASPLGSRKKTQQRKDYRDRTIAAAIANCKEIYETPSMNTEAKAKAFKIKFLTVKKGKEDVCILNTENICRILRSHPELKGRFRFDAFKMVLEIRDTFVWRPLEDNDAVDIQTQISIIFSESFGRVGKDMVYDAIIKVSKENTVDSAIDYVKSLVWDEVPRVDTWLTTVYGTPEDEYHKAVGSNWLKGLVKRIVEPGCKFDYVLVLEGPQGSKKSTSLNILGGDWYIETTISTDTKDFFMQFNGNVIVEFSEGETLSRTEVKRMKAVITTQIDKYRPAYGRAILNFPRRCVFAMTTNDEEYLKDDTGNRRWLPVTLVKEEADTEWLIINRDQLFAEAYYRVAVCKETVFEFPKNEMLEAQNARRIHYENTEQIVEWFYNKLSSAERDEGIHVHQVYRDCLNSGFSSKPLDRYTEMKIAGVLKDVLKLDRKRTMINNARSWKWYSKEPIPDALDFKISADEEFKIF